MPGTRRSKRKAAEIASPSTRSLTPPPQAEKRELNGEAEGGKSKKRSRSKSKKASLPVKKESPAPESPEEDADANGAEEEDEEMNDATIEKSASPKQRKGVSVRARSEDDGDVCFLGDPVPEEEAKRRWPHRYSKKNGDDVIRARFHYVQARVDGYVYNLNDDAYVKAGENEPDYIGRILEMFDVSDNELYFTAQWFFRAQDTVIRDLACDHDPRRVFLSDDKNDNALNCIVRKVRIIHIPPKVGPVSEEVISGFELYYDMSFSVAYSSFVSLPLDVAHVGVDTSGTSSTVTTCSISEASKSEAISNSAINKADLESEESTTEQKTELSLLDLFSGCGAMSSGLCLGANLAGASLRTRWAVDMNQYACKSLQINHPKSEVRNEKAEDFLDLIREWEILCKKYVMENGSSSLPTDDSDEEREGKEQAGEFEVEKLLGICYGKTENLDEVGLKFKVRWKGYGSNDDTWEPIDGLSNCEEKIRDFVKQGHKKRILPLPGTVDVICGGPPCQGISGFNRFRDTIDPFRDEKNKQLHVFMDIVKFLRPTFVLMENVVDILKFSKGLLGRYALSQLVAMKYQARLGILAAGNYGLPQYRMRVFLWGAHPAQILPQFPLPTHDVIVRGGSPVEFEGNVVAYDEKKHRQLEKALLLSDAISDLPPVNNDESRDEMSYGGSPKTNFQEYIRLTRDEMQHPISHAERPAKNLKLFDHRPLQLNLDDYQRVCRIPKHKGANFRDLPGVIVGPNNVVEWDPNVERVLLPSGKPLVPDYAMTFINGKSMKPFGRLWWDETVPTVVTRAEPHNQVIIHPEQDRVLTVRENARLQGFPDYYKLYGPIKQRYIQVGNAVAFPVSRALGFAFGLAYLRKVDGEPVLVLAQKFPEEI